LRIRDTADDISRDPLIRPTTTEPPRVNSLDNCKYTGRKLPHEDHGQKEKG